jgi:hypothetical protein
MRQTKVFCYRRWSFVADLDVSWPFAKDQYKYCELLAIRVRLLHVLPTREILLHVLAIRKSVNALHIRGRLVHVLPTRGRLCTCPGQLLL